MAAIKHLFHINAPRSKVFEALSTIEGLSNWWTVQTTGNAEIGGVIQFRFGDFEGAEMKVHNYEEDRLVEWECVNDNGWLGHMLKFELDDNEGKTRLRFSHDGWEETGDLYASCNFSWGRYLESLRQLCQTGAGQAFGSDAYV